MLAAAAPLLRLLRREAGGFQFVAPSSHAKSSAATGGAAFFGMERDLVLRTWLNTTNKVDELVEGYNGLLLVLDETMLAGDTDKERAQVIGGVAYRSVSGLRGPVREAQRGSASYVMLLSTSREELPRDRQGWRADRAARPAGAADRHLPAAHARAGGSCRTCTGPRTSTNSPSSCAEAHGRPGASPATPTSSGWWPT